MTTLMMGAAAGAVGTVGLNIATYLDMLIRGRSASEVPAKTAEKIAAAAGVDLSGAGFGDVADQMQQARASALGALQGYAAGVGVGLLYGAMRPWLGEAPLVVSGLALGVATMLVGNVPSISTGSTDPRTWGTTGWATDAIPHLVYGVLTAWAYEAFTAGPLGRKSTDRADYVSAAIRHSAGRLR